MYDVVAGRQDAQQRMSLKLMAIMSFPAGSTMAWGKVGGGGWVGVWMCVLLSGL